MRYRKRRRLILGFLAEHPDGMCATDIAVHFLMLRTTFNDLYRMLDEGVLTTSAMRDGAGNFCRRFLISPDRAEGTNEAG